MDTKGKRIEFRAHKDFHGFEGSIIINFPPFAVLAEENICIEVVPASILEMHNNSQKNKDGIKMATPIVHIDRKNDVAFLNDVTVTLPLLSNPKYVTSEGIHFEPGHFRLSQSKFSPVGVSVTEDASEERQMLHALRVDTNLVSLFRPLAVYLLIEQRSNKEFSFDLRQFESHEEHREFRLDERKSFRMIVDPQQVHDQCVYGTDVTVVLKCKSFVC